MNAFRSTGQSTRPIDLLPPDAAKRAAIRPVGREIVDVEFETVPVQARRSVYPVFNDNRRDTARPVASTREQRAAPGTLAAFGWLMGKTERGLQRVSAKVFAGLVAASCLGVFLLTFASNGIASSGVPAATTLTLEHVTTALNDANGMKVISVFGAIENRSQTAQTVPTVTVDVIDNGRKTASIDVAAFDEPLQPGDTRPFTVRMPHAGGKTPTVRLSFDQAGAQSR